MFTTQIKPFHVAIAAGSLSVILAAAPAKAAGGSEWLQQQLAITDGSPGYVQSGSDRTYAGAPSPVVVKTDTQSVWLQEQLAISDGSPGFTPSYVQRTPVGAAGPRADNSDAESATQFAFVQRELRKTDGSSE